jgi:hypothetical protein
MSISRIPAVIALGALAVALPSTAQAASSSVAPCRAVVSDSVVPVWARDGFSEKRPRMPQTLGRAGRIDALIFGNPLYSPSLVQRSNKILWVSRLRVSDTATLQITAQRMQGTRRIGAPVTRSIVGGPGPSIIDMPAAGCWRLSLAWSGHHDSLDLSYRPRIS